MLRIDDAEMVTLFGVTQRLNVWTSLLVFVIALAFIVGILLRHRGAAAGPHAHQSVWRAGHAPEGDDGAAVADLHRRLAQVHRDHRGRRQLLAVRVPRVLPRAGREVVGDHLERPPGLVRIGDRAGPGVDHRRAVVDRVVEQRPGVDDPVDQRHRHADRRLLGGFPEAPGTGRAVRVQRVAVAPVGGRQHAR